MKETIFLEPVEFQGWQCYRLRCGRLSVTIAPEVGGRIISLTVADEELFYTQPEHRGEKFRPEDFAEPREAKKKMGFRLWGGDKTWVAPQDEWWEEIPPLDLDAGPYNPTLDDDAVVLRSEVCRETGIRIRRSIKMIDQDEIILEQQFENRSEREIRKGIWNVTQFLRPFDVYILGDRSRFRPYEREGDSKALYPRLVHNLGDWTVIPCQEPLHFKFGGRPLQGQIIAVRHKDHTTLAHTRSFHIEQTGEYAHDSAVEIYNSADHDYLEIEVHAPLQPIPPRGKVRHQQIWRFNTFDERLEPDQLFKRLPPIP